MKEMKKAYSKQKDNFFILESTSFVPQGRFVKEILHFYIIYTYVNKRKNIMMMKHFQFVDLVLKGPKNTVRVSINFVK